MKIQEIITEAKQLSTQQIAEIIKTDCAPFLARIGNNAAQYRIWRGIHKKIPFFTKNPCPVNRKPLDTDKSISAVVDQWFFDNTGIRFRSNATFGTGDPDTATEYGNAFSIFPIGEFSFCWSPQVPDMTYSLLEYANANDQEGIDQIKELLVEAGYVVNKDLKGAIISGFEIMIHCPNGYYALAHIDNTMSQNYDKAEMVIDAVSSKAVAPTVAPVVKAPDDKNVVITGAKNRLAEIVAKIEILLKDFSPNNPLVKDLKKEQARLEEYLRNNA